jgi:hypothetical protein
LLASISGIVLVAGVAIATTQSVSAATLTTSAKFASGALAATSTCPKGTAPGITSHQVTVAATIVNISGGSLSNSTFGVPSAAAQQEDWNLVAKSINKAGGAGCRQIEMQFYDINPVDASAAQQTCLNIAAAHPYMVLDSGVLTEIGASNCLPAHQVPLASGYLTEEQLNQYHPYYLQIGDIPEDIINNGILGMKQLGLFSPSKGFRKIGVLYHTCSTDLVTAEQKALRAAGVTGKAVTSYSLGCPASGVDTPAAMEQAVLNFKSAGVSDVMMLEITDGGLFTQVAEQQNYKPQYLFAENDTAVNSTQSANAPNPANYNGAVDVLGGAYGEQSTPGYKPSGGTKACNAIYAAAGQEPVYSQTTGYPGVVCDYLWFVQALLSHASSVAPSAFPHDMRAMGTVEFSYPFAPVDFASAPAESTYGISFWRAAEFHESCKCWQVSSAEFHAPFK